MDHDEILERCKLIFTEMDDDALRIIGGPFFKINWRFADPRDDDARKDRMDHDENLERCKLIFTGMDDDALRIIGGPFFKINWRFADPRR
ncbi:hypothetical protein TNCV_753021 [Trichonephila clavipes]|uniref:Uncharacterized protein n=1 Tax=Trichonephila clavipes TaxID=2585209 RepID=A0A8X6WAR4_TRICX|nr:hypothetical protein TNCV_753021 [Trichonephila clavipes]